MPTPLIRAIPSRTSRCLRSPASGGSEKSSRATTAIGQARGLSCSAAGCGARHPARQFRAPPTRQYAITGQDVGFSLRLPGHGVELGELGGQDHRDPLGPIVAVGRASPSAPRRPSQRFRHAQSIPVAVTRRRPILGPRTDATSLANLRCRCSSRPTNGRSTPSRLVQTTFAAGRLVTSAASRSRMPTSRSRSVRRLVATSIDLPMSLPTDDGNYRAQIGPGPSRIVRASYRAHRLDRDPAATAQVQLAVLATGLLQAQRSRLTLGDQAVFRGRLAGDPFPASGIPVTLEAKDGPRWAQVAERGRTRETASSRSAIASARPSAHTRTAFA